MRFVNRYLLPGAVISAFYFGLFMYPLLRMLTLAFPGMQMTTPLLLVVFTGPLIIRLIFEAYRHPVTRWAASLAFTWLGVCFLSFPIVLAFEIFNLLLDLPQQLSGVILLCLSAALGLAAFLNTQIPAVRTINIPAPARLNGLRFAQISDVHVGSRSGRFLTRVVKGVNRLNVDRVLITGDLIDFRAISETEVGALATLNAPTHFIIGNHERYVDVDDICTRLTNLNVQVLRDSSIDLDGIQLVGIDDADARSQVENLLARIPAEPDRYRILLYHRPDGAEAAAAWGAHLMLCGHTHGGQIFPMNFLVKRVYNRIKGLYQIGDLHLYVSPGTGTWGPVLRLGTRSEITVIKFCQETQ
ncbi:MAG: metallophosphoesterase [Proteobacteria bacterium]|nr:metallophosphoesterase [Pseudomonadota bacterium]